MSYSLTPNLPADSFQETQLEPQLTLDPWELDALSFLVKQIVTRVESTKLDLGVACTANLVGLARAIYQARRQRNFFFDDFLCSEPGWDMLLAAYYLVKPDEYLSTTCLCHASCSSQTTGLRWMNKLIKADMLVRSPSKEDKRMIFVRLTCDTRNKMDDYLQRIATRYVTQPAAISSQEQAHLRISRPF